MCLISRCSALALDNSRDDFLLMAYIPPAFFYGNCVQKRLHTRDQFSFVLWFKHVLRTFLSSCHKFVIGFIATLNNILLVEYFSVRKSEMVLTWKLLCFYVSIRIKYLNKHPITKKMVWKFNESKNFKFPLFSTMICI